MARRDFSVGKTKTQNKNKHVMRPMLSISLIDGMAPRYLMYIILAFFVFSYFNHTDGNKKQKKKLYIYINK